MHTHTKEIMTSNPDIRLSEDVMMRVKLVNRLRLVLLSPILGLFAIVMLAVWADIIISFGDVVSNTLAHSNWSGYLSYIYHSFIHSRVVVQIIGSLMLVSGVFVAWKLLGKALKFIPFNKAYNLASRG